MNNKKEKLGTVVHSIKDFKALKSHKRFLTPFFHIHKSINVIIALLLVGYIIIHHFYSPPVSLSVTLFICYVGCIAINFFVFDHADHRVYVGDKDLAIKYKTITIRYPWTKVKDIARLSENSIMVTLIDGNFAILKNIRHCDELLALLDANKSNM